MTTAARAAVPGIGWMLLMSTWMLSTVIPGSMFAWLGFLSIGLVGRMRRWVYVGIGMGVAALAAALPIWGQWRPVVAAVVYLAGMLLALAANPSWLRDRWARAQVAAPQTPVTASPAARATSRGSRSRRRPAATSSKSASAAASEPQAARLAERAGASTSAYLAATSAESAEPVDVNTADASALAELPGLSRRRARSLVRRRDDQGGFASLDAFAAAAGLQPHELVALRRVATCSPRPRGPRQFGRRVDY